MIHAPEATGATHKPVSERMLLLVLAAVQFTTVLDFLIIMPLGPQYMRVFSITPGQFGLIVSVYAISAGISGVAVGFVLDRLDRKRALVGLYTGFVLGTLFCALAPGYHLLVVARAVAGAFGGVASALIMAIIGDVIPIERRGAAMGMVMSSFSLASIGGVPLGLYLATRFNWHVPFLALAGLSAVILAGAAFILPPLRGHLHHHVDRHPWAQMLDVLLHAEHRKAFLFMAALSCTGFLVFPHLSNYMVANVGLTEHQLPLIYLCGGSCTLFSMNWIGRWADRAGKLRVFTIMSFAAVIPVLLLTNLPRVPLVAAIATSTIFMICMSGRYVPAMAMMTSSIEARYRGGFMSINSSVQQFASGVAAFVSGHIMGLSPAGEITRYWAVGLLTVAFAMVSLYLARFLKVPTGEEVAATPLVAEV